MLTYDEHEENKKDVGSILSIQFFAIFDNLQRKKLRFSQKPMS
jgi:hypothetical protein